MTRYVRPLPKRLAGKSAEELLALARATGATERMQVWKADQALARELIRQGAMDAFQRANQRTARSTQLRKMDDGELLEEARRQIDKYGWQGMAEMKTADYALVNRLRARDLTRELAELYGWRTRRRTGKAAERDDPRNLSGRALADRALALQPTRLSDLHEKDSVLYHALRRDPVARELFRDEIGGRRAPVNWQAMSDTDWLAMARKEVVAGIRTR